MKIKALGLALSLGLGLSGCTGMSSTVDGKTHIFTGGQSCPALLEMDRGQTLEVILDENPSTGYVWTVAENLKLFKTEEIYEADQAKSEVPTIGKGGQKIYRFTATQAGEELLHLKHVRAWENAPVDEWQCRVRIS
ncbi:protease inhibitor I42 family protein [Acinetobacter pragensis]|uniref:protease inhibitor I42 family protein n=1 Tax=Acinetobacter pragensis TaxID=1806892 RepID=UPI00333EC2FB